MLYVDLGSNIGLCTIHVVIMGKLKWYMSSDVFVSDAIKGCLSKLAEAIRILWMYTPRPMPSRY